MANFHSIGGNEVEAHYAGGELLQSVMNATGGITGNDAEESAWLARTSEADGVASVRSIHGRTVRWNQLAPALTANAGYTQVDSYTTVTFAGGVASATAGSTGHGMAMVRGMPSALTSGHKIYVSAELQPSANGHQFGISLNVGTLNTNRVCPNTVIPSGAYTRLGGIVSYVETSTRLENGLRIAGINAETTQGDTLDIRNVMIVDLTAMFGAGSEPAVAEFEAMYHADYYPYDAGSLLPVSMTGIATEDANGNPLQTRTIPAGTLRSAGTVYDELTESEHITRIGVYTLTSDKVLEVATNSVGHTRVKIQGASDAMDISAAPSGESDFQMADNGLVFSKGARNYGTPGTFNIASGNNCFITLDETSITTLEQAKAWVQAREPITIYYPLATPTVTTYDPPLNMVYRTEHGGTERVMVPTGEQSAPPTIVAAQGYTAESLRDAALSAIAPVENGAASTNYGVGSYLVHGGQLCRVTTAIATGEAISIGTNVVTTTVMAEVIALTQ